MLEQDSKILVAVVDLQNLTTTQFINFLKDDTASADKIDGSFKMF